MRREPTFAVWKFASCDGCQLTLLDCEDELLRVAGRWRSRTSRRPPARFAGPYDVSLVEGSITTADDAERIRQVREMSRDAGHDRGVRDRGRHPGAAQLRRRPGVDVALVYATPDYHLHARDVDTDLRARARRLRAARLPDRPAQLLEVITATCWAASRTCRPTACASSASSAATSAWWSRTARRASDPVTHAGCGGSLPATCGLRVLRAERRTARGHIDSLHLAKGAPDCRRKRLRHVQCGWRKPNGMTGRRRDPRLCADAR